MEILLTLRSSNEIMMAQKRLRKEGIRMRIIGMPREISHDCGVAIVLREDDLDKVRTVILEDPFGVTVYYRRSEDGYEEIP